MAAEGTPLEYSCDDRIATITINRPDKLNAVSDEVVAQLADALRRFDLDPDAEVAILNGRGRAFSSGADVRQRQLRSRDEFEKLGGPQGWGTNSADLADPLGQLEAGHRGGARLCAGPGARPDARMRPDRRRRGHPVPADRDLARARRLALLGPVPVPRRRRVRRRDRAHRPLLHRRGRRSRPA